ncbi:hypothetical protein [Lentibacillus songyuanensis]|uniref:hypothetical protein n=1 Tax=Lentibacillus songyuanensis TaxID=3136161 RepID=UPI0031BA3A45
MERAGTSLKRARSGLIRARSGPKRAGTDPKRARSGPKRAGTDPKRARSGPKRATTSPICEMHRFSKRIDFTFSAASMLFPQESPPFSSNQQCCACNEQT